MQNLFRFDSEQNTGSIELRQWRYVKEGLDNNINKVIEFYRVNPIAVKSDHILLRLVQSMIVGRGMSFDRYVANCSSLALTTARGVGLTTSLSKGQLWPGNFYGKGSTEIIIAHSTIFSITDMHANWKDYSAVTVLQSEQSDMNLLIPDGRTNTDTEGMSIIAVNVPMLMAQYYRFNEEQDERALNGGARLGINYFIYMYGLVNMLKSHVDNVYFNRLYNRLIGRPNADPVRKHSFFLNDYTNSMDQMAYQQLDYIRKSKKRIGGVLSAVHMPVSGNLSAFSELPQVASTLQVFWALSLSRLKILSFVCLAQPDHERIDARELGTIRWLMRIQQTRDVIHANLGMRNFYEIVKYLDIPSIE